MVRGSGILMHISSLPSKYGIGTLGRQAYEFIDFLYESGQKYWQVLPICPTSYGNSPYQSPSVFAGNSYLIDLDFLVNEGILTEDDIKEIYPNVQLGRIDYGEIYASRNIIFEKIAERFRDDSVKGFYDFCSENKSWLDDYALFMSAKEAYEGKCWSNFDNPLKFRQKDALTKAREKLADKIRKHKILQFLFYRQWYAVKNYANLKGIKVIGDMPIYVAYDSADVWSLPEIFQLDGELLPTEVAGCPPDAFSPNGQLWGNPLYAWDYPERRDKIYEWWENRISFSMKIFDVARIDHFRGFADYYSIPAQNETAVNGRWREGAGKDFFDYLKANLGELPIIAEDLGFLTDKVRDLLSYTGFPGMKVLQFGFDSNPNNEYLPHNYTKNSVVYVGTHDNQTAKEWIEGLSDHTYEFAKSYMNLCGECDVWAMIKSAMASVSDIAIFTIQDLLCLGKEGRMNIPSTSNSENWSFRVCEDYERKVSAPRLRALTQMYGR